MFGQIPDFTNSFDFMRRLWGSGTGMPGGLMPGLQAMTPPMDLDDLDKRIADLKAVESWLQLNTNLLRTTIQGLEVQRATLVALQTFGNALSPEAMQSAMENVARAANAPSATPPERAGADTGTSRGAATHAPAQEPPAATAGTPESAESAEAASGGEAEPAESPNAGLWWDMLQQQFNQIASSAAAASIAPFGMGGFGGAGSAGSAGTAATSAAATPAPTPAAKPKSAPRKTAAAAAGTRSPAKPAGKQAPATKSARAKAPAKGAANGSGNGSGHGKGHGNGNEGSGTGGTS
ncbi:PhaM family polyhydroxyalkanoate granule multifunctional regulatory protein [Cupriavidus necator]|uniref:PhaM family polyhydroxyalkanoate granule multifunctional regulatory protein n=1 Tax=Cupriavidus necator TaxID=106590 RepID=UPI00339D2EAC